MTLEAPQIKRSSGQWALSRARHKAHARRKFHDLHANHRSELAGEALRYFGALYEIEREAREQRLGTDGTLRAGQRAANVMSVVQSAKLNGHDPYRYLKDVLDRLPTQPASRLEELLPRQWQPSSPVAIETAA